MLRGFNPIKVKWFIGAKANHLIALAVKHASMPGGNIGARRDPNDYFERCV